MNMQTARFVDKTGRTIILKSAENSDAASLIQFLKITSEETPYLIREPEEITLTEPEEKNFIETKLSDERELLMVAQTEGEHIGNCAIMSMGTYKRYAHRCEIAIALYRKYWGCGIACEMMSRALQVAREMGYEQIELEVIADNKGAIHLYEKLGFSKIGEFPHNMKYGDGTYADAWRMCKVL